jgi:hypothetical protein
MFVFRNLLMLTTTRTMKSQTTLLSAKKFQNYVGTIA